MRDTKSGGFIDHDWVVHCHVSGGVTGTRQSLLKSNDLIRYFTEDEARAKAAELNKVMNTNYSVASFKYRAEKRGVSS
jgi:hypothetical protein